MPYYPLFLDITGRPVLVVGAGKVALRKIRGVLECGAVVTVVAPEGVAEIGELPVKWKRRRFRRTDVRGMALVFAATDSREVNRRVASLADELGILVNVADSREECRFLVPARVRRGGVSVAISTEGESPRRAVAVRRLVEGVLGA